MRKIALLILTSYLQVGCDNFKDTDHYECDINDVCHKVVPGKSLFSVWESETLRIDLSQGQWVEELRYEAATNSYYTVYVASLTAHANLHDGSVCDINTSVEASFKTDGSISFAGCPGFPDQVKFSLFSNHQYFGTSLHLSGFSWNPTEVLY